MKLDPNVPVFLERVRGEPLDALETWLQGDPVDSVLLVDFEFSPWWLPAATPHQDLTALYYLDASSVLRCGVTDAALQVSLQSASEQLAHWKQAHHLAFFVPGQPLRLAPVSIPKPWGQEIWFTGVEERGVCHFSDGLYTTPIPWLQAVMPESTAGQSGCPLILLKILDPFAEEVRGDLYFELHEEKREVYVVTHVDETAWPGGIGGIRYGFDPERVSGAASEDDFRTAYLEAVEAYESTRREIDRLPDAAEASPELLACEKRLREIMNAFTHVRELRVGDVLAVPLLVPHSLQHGVRTIEFQTPVYERQILSFAQRVLTQDHWDTAAAIQKMQLLPPTPEPFRQLPADEGVGVERIVDFADFEVRRLAIAPNCKQRLQTGSVYGLVMVVTGELQLADSLLGPEQAAFLPAGGVVELSPSRPDSPLVLLLAMPCV